MNTVELTGFHKLELKLANVAEHFEPEEVAKSLNPILEKFFCLQYSNFTLVDVTKSKRRGYTHLATFDNKIWLYFGSQEWTKGTAILDISGGAFDAGLVDLASVKQYLRANPDTKIRELHAYADDPGDVLPFNKLWKCQQNYRLTSGHYEPTNYPGTFKGAGRSLVFGKKTLKKVSCQTLTIYEKGVKEPEAGRTLDHVRVEIRFWGAKAELFITDWLENKPLHALIKATIAGTVQFRTLAGKDTNVSRLPILPEWQKYLAGIQPVKYVVKRDPTTEKDLKIMFSIALKQLRQIKDRFDPKTFQTLIDAAQDDGEAQADLNRMMQEQDTRKDEKLVLESLPTEVRQEITNF